MIYIKIRSRFSGNNLPYVRRVRQADFVERVEDFVDWGVICRDDKREVIV